MGFIVLSWSAFAFFVAMTAVSKWRHTIVWRILRAIFGIFALIAARAIPGIDRRRDAAANKNPATAGFLLVEGSPTWRRLGEGWLARS